MAYDPGAIDATLTAAVGDAPALIAELRVAFVESADSAVQALEQAKSDAEWRDAAARLTGLAASFGAVRLMAMANRAATLPHDAPTLAKLKRTVARL